MQKMIAQSRQSKIDKVVENNLTVTHPLTEPGASAS